MGGIAGFATWQGWPRLQVAMAQKGEPTGQMTWALHISIAPTWFDPAETSGIITSFLFLYAMHDALVKPMPDNKMASCLATKWSESADGLIPGNEWGSFVDMYDPKSPWYDKRVRLAANHAIDRHAINEAETFGFSRLSGGIIPRAYDFALPLEPYAYDPKKAKALLKEAGHPNGFDAGEYSCDAVYAGVVVDLIT